MVGSNHHSGIKTTTKLMTLEAKVCNYKSGLSVKYNPPKLAIFTPVPTSTQDVLAITLLYIKFMHVYENTHTETQGL